MQNKKPNPKKPVSNYHQRYGEKNNRKLIKNVKEIIIVACGGNYHENFKAYLTLQELIEYKNTQKSSDELFQLYISAIHNIIESIQNDYPFINLEGIDLTWTPQDIIDAVIDLFYNPNIVKLTIKDLEVPKRFSKENGLDTKEE